MKLKLIITALVVAAMPMYAQAQSPNPPKPSKPAKAAPAVPAAPVSKVVAAQKVVKTISGDKKRRRPTAILASSVNRSKRPRRKTI